jgi:hypothetical protein
MIPSESLDALPQLPWNPHTSTWQTTWVLRIGSGVPSPVRSCPGDGQSEL